MMKTTGFSDDKVMQGLWFKDERPIANETVSFKVRQCREGVELHIIYVTQQNGKKTSTRHIYLTFEPESFRALQVLINTIRLPRALDSTPLIQALDGLQQMAMAPDRLPLIDVDLRSVQVQR